MAVNYSMIKMMYFMDMLIAAVLLVVSVCLILISMVILRFIINFTITSTQLQVMAFLLLNRFASFSLIRNRVIPTINFFKKANVPDYWFASTNNADIEKFEELAQKNNYNYYISRLIQIEPRRPK